MSGGTRVTYGLFEHTSLIMRWLNETYPDIKWTAIPWPLFDIIYMDGHGIATAHSQSMSLADNGTPIPLHDPTLIPKLQLLIEYRKLLPYVNI